MSPGHQVFATSLAFSAFLFLAGASQALTLGPAMLESQPDETLLVSIPLSELGTLSLNSLSVSLEAEDAQDEAFVRRLAWRVQAAGTAAAHIVLQSPAPLPEEGLRVRLEVRWPDGETWRNYTLSPDHSLVAESVPSDATESRASLQGNAESYEIQAEDTLWQIASSLSPSLGASPQQVMLAIQQLNPQAFADGNINRMIAGFRLRLPGADDVRSVNEDEAIQRVAQQNAAVGLQGVALLGMTQASGVEAGEGQDALRIITITAGDAELLAAEDRIMAMEQRLLISEESLDQVRLESEELQSRLQDMDAQIEVLDIIVELESQQVNERQQALAALATGAGSVQDAGQPAEAAVTAGAASAPAVAPMAVSPDVSRPAPEASAQVPLGASNDWQAALLDALRQPFVLASLMAGMVVLMLAALVIRRRRDEAARAQESGLPLDPIRPVSTSVKYWDPAGTTSQEWLTDDLPRNTVPSPAERLVFEQLAVDEHAFTDSALEAEPEEEELQGMLPEEASQLDLAVAYHAMGRHAEAREALNRVLEEGSVVEIDEARRLQRVWDGAPTGRD